jgi:hypothetical protein
MKMRINLNMRFVTLSVLFATCITAQTASIPPVPDPAVKGNPPCGGNEVSTFYQKVMDLISKASKGIVTPGELAWAFQQSGLARSYSSNCLAVMKQVDANSEVWLNFGDRDIKHPWFCQGYRTAFDSQWAAAENMQSLPLPNGKYLVMVTFKNWDHKRPLTVSIDEFPMGKGYSWFTHCGNRTDNRVQQ